MPVPTAYTESTLADLIVNELAGTATALVWTNATTQVVEAVYDALFDYHGGAGTIANATNIPKLRALARVYAWRAAKGALASGYNISLDGQSMSRSQHFDHASRMEAQRSAEAAQYGGAGNVVRVDTLRRPDPYVYQTTEQLEAFF